MTLLSGPMLFLALLVRSKLGSPVLFSQVRPGLNGQPFTMYKFRTMTDERGPDGERLPDAVRLTAFGKFLRSTSLDELPELLNILKGDMSLVGPRPLLMEYLPLQRTSGPPPRSSPWTDRLGAGQRPQCPVLGREIRA